MLILAASMRAASGSRFTRLGLQTLVVSALLFPGCAHIEDQFRETGPSVDSDWNSPTAADVYARFEPGAPRMRDWNATPTQAESGVVTHAPLYFQDPFEDKGSGHSEPRIGWEDVIATPYGYARFTLNGLLLPVSMIVTLPWTEMESDGVLSRQALGYDHDPEPTAGTSTPRVPPAAGDEAPPMGQGTTGERAAPAASPQMNGLQVIRP